MTDKPGLATTLDDAVAGVANFLWGQDLSYLPELDVYRTITHQLNRALRLNALEKEWSYYSSVVDLGHPVAGERSIQIPATLRPRIINDDSVRLVDDCDTPRRWAYFIPRDALHKYSRAAELRCAVTNQALLFSRPFTLSDEQLRVQVPAMREPTLFELPAKLESIEDLETPALPATTITVVETDEGVLPEPLVLTLVPSDPPYYTLNPEEALGSVTPDNEDIREQLLDFQYPDVIILRAAFLYAQSDPVLQPRVQTIEAQYKDLMYQIIERDDRNTDTPYLNNWSVPIQNGLIAGSGVHGGHPHADRFGF